MALDPAEDARDEQERAEDAQDGEAVRIAAYSGLRQGELLELRWSDIDWHGSALTVSRARSANVVTSPKSRKVRRVPMADPAARALERLSRRPDFTAPDELVLVNPVAASGDPSLRLKEPTPVGTTSVPLLRGYHFGYQTGWNHRFYR